MEKENMIYLSIYLSINHLSIYLCNEMVCGTEKGCLAIWHNKDGPGGHYVE
jgi:hypothetical protein